MKNEQLITSLNAIQPDEAARERMLRNIAKKASKTKTNRLSQVIRWIAPTAIVLVGCAVFAIVFTRLNPTGPSKDPNLDGTHGNVNGGYSDFYAYDFDELSEAFGHSIFAPQELVPGVLCLRSGKFVEITLSYHEKPFLFRACANVNFYMTPDGVVESEFSYRPDEDGYGAIHEIASNYQKYGFTSWVKNGIHYVLICEDEATPEELIEVSDILYETN